MAFPQAATTPVAPDERLVDPECCQACGGPLHVRFASVRDVQTRAVFSILECAPCGLDNTAPRSKELAKYYRGYHGGRHGMTASYCARRRLRILRQVVGGAAGHLLDIGCGDGTFLLAARTAGWSEYCPCSPSRTRGLSEYLRYAFACAVRRHHPVAHLRTLGRPRAILGDIRRLLSANGALTIAVPNAGGLQARIFCPSGSISMFRATCTTSPALLSPIFCNPKDSFHLANTRNLNTISWDGPKALSICLRLGVRISSLICCEVSSHHRQARVRCGVAIWLAGSSPQCTPATISITGHRNGQMLGRVEQPATRVLKWRSCSSFSISVSAALSPIVSSTTGRTPRHAQKPRQSPTEAAYHKADDAIQEIINLLKAT